MLSAHQTSISISDTAPPNLSSDASAGDPVRRRQASIRVGLFVSKPVAKTMARGRGYRSSSAPNNGSTRATRKNIPQIRILNHGIRGATLSRRFDVLADAWVKDTEAYSSVGSIRAHRAFPLLTAMGRHAIKRALLRLKNGDVRVHWLILLKSISGEDPVPPENRGRVHLMAQHWLKWGKNLLA